MAEAAQDLGLDEGELDFAGKSDSDRLAAFTEDEIEITFADAAEGEQPRAEGDGGTDDDNEDLSNYSQNVRKRIERERRLKREAREGREAAELRAQTNERIAAEERAARQRLESELAALRQTPVNVTDTADIDRQIAEKTAKFKQVRAEFDPDKAGEELDLMHEIAELRQKKAQPRQAAPLPVPTAAPAPPPLPAAAQRWIDRNPWFHQDEFAMQKAAAIQLDNQLRAQKLDPHSDGYYAELDRQLKRAIVLPGAKRDNGASPAAAPPAGAPTSKRRVTLDRSDLAFMQKIGLDPKNPEHVKSYAKEKIATMRDDA